MSIIHEESATCLSAVRQAFKGFKNLGKRIARLQNVE